MKARHRLRTNVVDQHVRLCREREAGLARRVLLQVERDRTLVAVGIEEDRAHARIPEGPGVADDIALERLDLDYLRAEIAEDLGRVRAHDDRGEVQDADPMQRTAHSGWIPASLTSFAQRAISLWM